MKILIRSPNWVGDAVFCLSSIAYLKEKMPQAHIAVLAKDWVKEIFLNHPAIDEIIPFDKPRISLINEIKKSNFDVGILFTNSFSSAFLFFLAGLKKRLGYKTDLRSVFLTDGVSLPKNLENLHQRNYYFEIAKKLVPGNEIPKNPSLYLTSKEIEKADNILESLGIYKTTRNENPQSAISEGVRYSASSESSDRNLIVGICPGASYGPAKTWGIEKFKSLAEKITKNKNTKVLIFGSKKEKKLGEIISKDIEDIINLCGKTTTRELMALIKKCHVLITNDSGPMHVAAALNVPVVAIFGPTSTHIAPPLGPSIVIKKEVSCSPCKYRICPLKEHECMEKISVKEVFEAVEKQLE